MSVIPEIVFQALFIRAIQRAKEDPDLIRHIMRNFDIKAQEETIAYVQREFFRVVTQFPRTDVTYPMIWIALRNENEQHQFLGDMMDPCPPADMTYDMSDLSANLNGGIQLDTITENNVGQPQKLYEVGQYVETIGVGLRHTYAVEIMAEGSPNAVLFLYTLLKAVIFQNKGFLSENHVDEIVLSGGDLAPMPELLPTHVFSRTMNIQCVSYFTVPNVLNLPSTLEFEVVLCQDNEDLINISSE